MALVGSEMKSRFEATIHAGLVRVFSEEIAKGQGYPPIVDPMWQKLADALSDIAMDIVNEIQENAEVVQGQAVLIPVTSTPGSPSTGATVSPGKII